MTTPFTFTGAVASIVQEINNPPLFSATTPSTRTLSGRGFFSNNSNPQFPSNIEDVVVMTQNAYFDANIEIGGNLTVDGILSSGAQGAQTIVGLTVTPGNLNVVGGTIVGGVNTIASNIQPDGVRSAGATTLVADAGHIHQNFCYQNLLLAPTGAISETAPRRVCGSQSNTLPTSTLNLSAISLNAGAVISNLTAAVTAVARGLTHGFYVLTDSNLIVRAVTADQTGGTTWTSVSTSYTLPFTSGYTVPTTGLYYVGINTTGSTTPTLSASASMNGGLNGSVPIMAGTSTAAQTTPPAIGSTQTTITPVAANNIYFYVS